ncbi:Pre-mRNA splicing Prp18-interacting factor-domain-containing protein [Kockiozyma suomiensis]|uniref:Pre-mRNA splicing Prp18-interacting factor-domain-containing protein n=1 Tax=Kockiozyma suomiensis TaxID=1337062 RepID=UPI0033440DBA
MADTNTDSVEFKFNTFGGKKTESKDSPHDSLLKRNRRGKDKDVPIEIDADGKEINPYIPNFISKAPWYVDQSGEASLRHQRLREDRDKREADLKDVWYKRGVKAGPAATKYRKGACENCGAITHKTRDCMERPRKLGAKWTGQDIQADDLIQDVPMTWDSKRDRWNGYDPSEHAKIIEEYQKVEELRKKVEEQEKDSQDSEEEKEEDSGARGGSRSVRIREDVAKYLKRLDVDDDYNPKSRQYTGDADILASADDFVRQIGDEAKAFEDMKQFAWEVSERGQANVHLQANPTEGVILKRKLDEEAHEKNEKAKKQLLDRYGGSEYLQDLPKELKAVPQEDYKEYSESGELIKGKPATIPKSQYPEDVYPGNHSSVWGSWWHDFKWGYACCHSTMKQSYCTGDAGIKAASEPVL